MKKYHIYAAFAGALGLVSIIYAEPSLATGTVLLVVFSIAEAHEEEQKVKKHG